MSIKFSGSESNQLFSDINMTPFVDIVLVLLLIFMMSAPLMVINLMGLTLPKTSAVEDFNEEEAVLVSIDKEGQILFGQQKLSADDLTMTLLNSPKVLEGSPVYLEADEMVRHKSFVKVMAAIKKAHVSKIFIVSEEGQD